MPSKRRRIFLGPCKKLNEFLRQKSAKERYWWKEKEGCDNGMDHYMISRHLKCAEFEDEDY